MYIEFSEMKEVLDNVYLIKKGVRSCYMEIISGPEQNYESGIYDNPTIILSVFKKLKAIEKYVKEEGLYFYSYKLKDFEEDIELGNKSYCFWIYKYPHQGILLEHIPREHGFVEEWIIGKLLGYSDESMEKFLSSENQN